MSSSPADLRPLLFKLQLWNDLDPGESEAVLALPHKAELVEAAKYIVREGDQARYSCLLLSGFAIRHKLAGNGSRSISAIHMKGDLVDLQNSLLCVADHNVQALTACHVAFIPREAVRQIAFALPNVGLAMWHDTLVDASIFREWILNVSRRDASTRLAHLLCEFGLRLETAQLGSRWSYELPMTQEQLADATGLTSVHVNRMLKYLESQNLIRRTVRSVVVRDWDRLVQAADFASAYLHLPDRSSMLQ